MPLARPTSTLFYIGAVNLVLMLSGNAAAQTVWSGLSFTFTKANFADPSQPANQDRITDNVWLTRDVQQGIFNIRLESMYGGSTSPADTEWATDLMLQNEGETIAAANWADLSFTGWVDAYGGTSSQELPARLIGRDAVVHLISEDIYLDLRFTDWRQGGGGGFSYDRAVGILPPATTGDYNENGVVDAADYVVWRKTLNQSAVPAGSGADGDGDGTIDSDDYDFWTARFGNTVPGSGGGAMTMAAPEPAAAILLLIGITCFRVITRSRRGSSRQAWNSVT